MAPMTKTSLHQWIPDQPGAWVMAASPALSGLVAGAWFGSLTVDAVWLTVCWLLCYCVQFTAARWLKSHGSRRFLPPALGYGALLAVVGLPFLLTHPGILWWAPPIALLAAISFASSWLRRERSLWANAAAVCASCLMPMLTFCYGVDEPRVPYVSAVGLSLSLSFALTQFGSVLFVKTMIRERGSRAYLAVSWLWHAAFLLLAARAGSVWLGALCVLLLARAVALPLTARRRRVPPLATGLTECVSSLCAFVAVTASVLV